MTNSTKAEHENAKAKVNKRFSVLMGLMNDRLAIIDEIEQQKALAGEAAAEALISGKAAPKASSDELAQLQSRLVDLEATATAVNRRWAESLETERKAAKAEQKLQEAEYQDKISGYQIEIANLQEKVSTTEMLINNARAEFESLKTRGMSIDDYLDRNVGIWRGSIDDFESDLSNCSTLPINRVEGLALVDKWRRGYEIETRWGGRMRVKCWANEVVVFFENKTGKIVDSRIIHAINEGGISMMAGRTISLGDIESTRDQLELQYTSRKY